MKLNEKCMLVRLSISQWSGRKLDKNATEEVANNHGTDSSVGRYTKEIISSSRFDAIKKIATEARQFNTKNTLPWLDDGSRILPMLHFDKYTEGVREIKARYETAVQDFIAAYPSMITAAQRRLNGLFNEADYPDVSELESKFKLKYDINPIPAADDFRVQLTAGDVDNIRTEIEERMNIAHKTAMADLYSRIQNVTRNFIDRMKCFGEKSPDRERAASFRDSLVTNIRDLVDILPGLNFNNDSKIADLMVDLESLGKFQPEELRKSDRQRENATKAAETILDKMKDIVF